MHKLLQLNLDRKLLTWIEFFLNNRSQYVAANAVNSRHTAVQSGVPQGSVLGPLLFLIYVNDLPTCLYSHVHLFADDCVIFRELSSDADVTALQTDLTAVSIWCQKWLMQLNVNKCKVMRVSRTTNSPPTYSLNDLALDTVSSYKYLGLHITSPLNWAIHTEHMRDDREIKKINK